MKVALCISGQQRQTKILQKEIDKRRLYAFKDVDVDFFLHTWKNQILFYYDDLITEVEPNIDYDPVLDTTEWAGSYFQSKRKEKKGKSLYNSTKQILAHNTLVSKLKKDYDIIIRCRWDIYFSENINYSEWLKKSYNEGPISMGHRGWNLVYLDNPKPMGGLQKKGNLRWEYMISPDAMIIHKPKDWDCNKVISLHKKKELLPGEWGWYQILSSGKNNHKGYHGGVLTLAQRW